MKCLSKKIIFIFSVIMLVLIENGCSNITSKEYGKLTFGLGDSVVEEIKRSVTFVLKDDSTIKVECQIEGDDSTLQSQTVVLSELNNVDFILSNIPIGKSVKIQIRVIANNKIIYSGISDPVKVEPGSPSICKIVIVPYKNKITYLDSDGSEFAVEEYTIKDKHILNEGKKTGFRFDGWYFDKDFSQKVNEPSFGKNCFAGNVTLYGKWIDIVPPGEIPSITFTADDSKIVLSWEEPSDEDLASVLISYEGIPEGKAVEIEKGVKTKEFTGLTNGKTYNFTLSAKDTTGNIGTELNKSFDLYVLTENYEILKDYQNPDYHEEGWQYVKFGDWPQSEKNYSTSLSANTTKVNTWDCYFGSDGCYYVKVTAKTDESVYDYYDGQECYFKIEPIYWRILTDNYVQHGGPCNRKLLFAEKALFSYRLSNNGKNIYADCDLEHYLNGTGKYIDDGFINKAFTQKAIDKIAVTAVDHSNASTTVTGQPVEQNQYASDSPTNDKIFILSRQEVTNTAYGFPVETGGKPARKRITTPYSRATGIYARNKSDHPDYTWWRLRSPSTANADNVRGAAYDGSINYDVSIGGMNRGIVPALTLK